MNEPTNDNALADREQIGGNRPPEDVQTSDLPRLISGREDLAAEVTAFLETEYAAVKATIRGLLIDAGALVAGLPNRKIEDSDEETSGKFAKLIKRLREEKARLEAFHGKESTPYWRSKQAADQFFFGEIDKVARRDKKNKAGAADILQSFLDDYLDRKLAKEQARLAQEAAERERVRRAAEAEAEAARKKAEDDRLAAERARLPDTQAAKGAVAAASETDATRKEIGAEIAGERAEEAKLAATTAKPADLVRERAAEGPLVTMERVAYAEVTNESELDKVALWPYVPFAAKEQAVREWAKATGYKKEMPGASIGYRNKGRVR